MKKLVSSVLSLAMLLSLADCSGGDHSSTSAGGSTSSNTGSSANTSGDSSTAPQVEFPEIITVTVPFNAGSNTDIQMRFFRALTAMGIAVTIISNPLDE